MLRWTASSLAIFLTACELCSTPPPPTAAVAPPTTFEAPAEIAPPASALPAERRGPTREQLREFRASLAHGRTYVGQGQQAEAVAAFQSALAQIDDPRARCELGWAEFRLGRLDDAQNDLSRAVQGAQPETATPARRSTFGACLYNLGRVAQARGDVAKAAEAYRRSLAFRDNETVSAALRDLDAPPPAAGDCERACDGPYASFEALRAALDVRYGRLLASGEHDQCTTADGPPPRWSEDATIAGSGLYLQASVALYEGGPDACISPAWSVAVVHARLETGWFGCAAVEAYGSMGESIRFDADDFLVVRGAELAARPNVYDDSWFQDHCIECEESEPGCSGGCMDEHVPAPMAIEAAFVVRDGALVPRRPICLRDDAW